MACSRSYEIPDLGCKVVYEPVQPVTPSKGSPSYVKRPHVAIDDDPQLLNYRGTTYGECFLHFFPVAWLEAEGLAALNEAGSRKYRNWKPVDLGWFLRFLSALMLAAINCSLTRNELWQTTQRYGLAELNLSQMTGISKEQFTRMLASLSFAAADTPKEDPHRSIRPFISAFNSHMAQAFSPGKLVTVDETMSAWSRMINMLDGCWRHIPNKPTSHGAIFIRWHAPRLTLC